jgi:hypothetical protein
MVRENIRLENFGISRKWLVGYDRLFVCLKFSLFAYDRVSEPGNFRFIHSVFNFACVWKNQASKINAMPDFLGFVFS